MLSLAESILGGAVPEDTDYREPCLICSALTDDAVCSNCVEGIEMNNDIVAKMADAARPYCGSASLELCRNIALPLMIDADDGIDSDAEAIAREAIVHRRRYFGLKCLDVIAASKAIAGAWKSEARIAA